jgi:hypothetical protein
VISIIESGYSLFFKFNLISLINDLFILIVFSFHIQIIGVLSSFEYFECQIYLLKLHIKIFFDEVLWITFNFKIKVEHFALKYVKLYLKVH